MNGLLMFGKTPVPKTASWSAEEGMFIAPCLYFDKRPAICQADLQGVGTPLFGKPHSVRQRRAIALCLCELCGKTMKATSKISLSHARPQPHGAEGWAILQVEPMLHAECAAMCVEHCPSLKRDVRDGSVQIRIVSRWRAQCAIMDEAYTKEVTGQSIKALGHAKVELLQWKDRDLKWLKAANT